jgi:hypothetical protein
VDNSLVEPQPYESPAATLHAVAPTSKARDFGIAENMFYMFSTMSFEVRLLGRAVGRGR